jgi:hypothetical protein
MFKHKRIKATESMMSDDENRGACTACGEEALGVEPDAREYECECCGEKRVYGLQELLLMNLIDLVDDVDDLDDDETGFTDEGGDE